MLLSFKRALIRRNNTQMRQTFIQYLIDDIQNLKLLLERISNWHSISDAIRHAVLALLFWMNCIVHDCFLYCFGTDELELERDLSHYHFLGRNNSGKSSNINDKENFSVTQVSKNSPVLHSVPSFSHPTSYPSSLYPTQTCSPCFFALDHLSLLL